MKIRSVAILGAGAVGSYLLWGLTDKSGVTVSVVAEGTRADRLRRAMQAGGQWIAAVETTPGASAALRPKIVQTADGGRWWYAFTSFDEQMKSPDAVKSTFWADINSLFDAALAAEEIQGIILNPWHCTLQLDKTLIRIIKP